MQVTIQQLHKAVCFGELNELRINELINSYERDAKVQ